MDDEPADEIEATDPTEADVRTEAEVRVDNVVERRARVRAVLDGHPVASADPPSVPPRLELLR